VCAEKRIRVTVTIVSQMHWTWFWASSFKGTLSFPSVFHVFVLQEIPRRVVILIFSSILPCSVMWDPGSFIYRWRWYPSTNLHGVTSQINVILMFSAVIALYSMLSSLDPSFISSSLKARDHRYPGVRLSYLLTDPINSGDITTQEVRVSAG
jgi:hypothetical protein